MSKEHTTEHSKTAIEAMFKAGAHFGYNRSRRHPTTKPYIFGTKNKVEIFDLEKTLEKLEEAKQFIAGIVASGKPILLVAGKNEAREVVRSAALALGVPYVASRWIGGTLTNFPEIRRRIEKMENLEAQRDRGELAKYTKKERLLIDQDIERLRALFGGLTLLKERPAALFVIDSKKEEIAVKEALDTGVPVIALANSDCDLHGITYVIPGNDASVSSITYFVNEIAEAIRKGKLSAPAAAPQTR
jgi:small subunit ribosomal protein S2